MKIFILIIIAHLVIINAIHCKQSIYDHQTVDTKIVSESLNEIKQLLIKEQLFAADFKSIYFAEINLGKYIGNYPLEGEISEEYKRGKDSALLIECIKYVKMNKRYFNIVDDGWKGEENFWEPTRYWLYRSQERYSNSIETLEMGFDLDFKEFIRQYDFDEIEAKGKDCEEYIKYITTGHKGDVYREMYSENDIKTWLSECKIVRNKFRSGKNKLLQKYHNAPFTKILQEIDETIIVVLHSVC